MFRGRILIHFKSGKNHIVKLSQRNTEAYVGSFQLFFQSASSGIYDFGHIPVCQSSAKGWFWLNDYNGSSLSSFVLIYINYLNPGSGYFDTSNGYLFGRMFFFSVLLEDHIPYSEFWFDWHKQTNFETHYVTAENCSIFIFRSLFLLARYLSNINRPFNCVCLRLRDRQFNGFKGKH